MLEYKGSDVAFKNAMSEYNHAFALANKSHIRSSILAKVVPNLGIRLASLIQTAASQQHLQPWLVQNYRPFQGHIDQIQILRIKAGLEHSEPLQQLRNSLSPPVNWKGVGVQAAKVTTSVAASAALFYAYSRYKNKLGQTGGGSSNINLPNLFTPST